MQFVFPSCDYRDKYKPPNGLHNESLIPAGIVLPGVTLSMSSTGISLPGAFPLPGSFLSNPVPATLPQSGLASHNSVAITQKLNQPKIQDELIAREIVINDAEPTIRYKLTKRQTQEEIQKCSAVVISRGKYKPPNGLPDNEKPLYLHISAGAQCSELFEQVAAIKQLNRDGLQGCKEYLVEVLMLIMLQHPNLVTLIGYCAEGDERLLVYECMAQGSLEDHLFANEKLTHLPAKFPRMEPISLRREFSKLHHVYEPTKNEGTAPANAALPLACPQQGDGSFITGVIANNMDKKCHQQQHSSSSQVIPVHSSPLRTKIASHDKTDPRERFMSIP